MRAPVVICVRPAYLGICQVETYDAEEEEPHFATMEELSTLLRPHELRRVIEEPIVVLCLTEGLH